MLHVGVCWKQFACQILVRGPKKMEITVHEIATVGRMVCHLPATAPYPATSPVGSLGLSCIVILSNTARTHYAKMGSVSCYEHI